jgi:RNA dependent RNA polymerase
LRQVSRNPTTVASDIQKVINDFLHLIFVWLTSPQVEAVENEQLADYINVVVFSIKGSRSLASFLSGGGSSPSFPPLLMIKLTVVTIRPDYDGGALEKSFLPFEIYKR